LEHAFEDSYFKQHKIPELFAKLIKDLQLIKPEQPVNYIAKFFQNEAKKNRR